MTQSGTFMSGQQLDSKQYPLELLQHLVEIGSAIDLEVAEKKIDNDREIKKKALVTQSLPPGKVSPKKTRSTRKPRATK